jgi:hypothetical protein
MPETIRKGDILSVVSQTLLNNCRDCNYRCPVHLFKERKKKEPGIVFDIGEGEMLSCCKHSGLMKEIGCFSHQYLVN